MTDAKNKTVDPINVETSALIMSVYRGDQPDYLSEAIDSIFAANHHPKRIYIGIDGPLEEPVARVLDSARTRLPSLNLVRFQANRGLAHVLNDLIDLCIADPDCRAVFRMDADDVCCADRFDIQLSHLNDRRDIAVFGGAAHVINESGHATGEMLVKHVSDAALKRRLGFDSPFVHPTVAFNADVLRAGWRYPVDHVRFEDVALWADMAVAGLRFANTPSVLIKYRLTAATAQRRAGVAKAVSECSVRIRYVFKMMPWRLDIVAIVLGIALVKLTFPVRIQRLLFNLRQFLLSKT